jgi:hypothetical protein
VGEPPTPDDLDLKAAYPLCPAWTPYAQGNCASCCSAAIATIISAQECLEYARASRFSMTQVWDCTAYNDGTCAYGVSSPMQMIENLAGDWGRMALLPETCDNGAPVKDANRTTCAERSSQCSDKSGRSLGVQSVVVFDVWQPASAFRTNPYDADMAMLAMMREIWDHGPVLSLIKLYGADVTAFQKLGPHAGVFQPKNSSDVFKMLYHCLVVYGWGKASDGTPYWRVLNSYGVGWGDQGTARIVRGANVLEGQWRALKMTLRPCTPSEKECATLAPYASVYGNYSKRRLASSATPPPLKNDTTTPFLIAESPPLVLAPALHNGAILGIAIGAASLVTVLSIAWRTWTLPSHHAAWGLNYYYYYNNERAYPCC